MLNIKKINHDLIRNQPDQGGIDSEIPVSLEKSEIEQRLLALELRVLQIESCLPVSKEMIVRF
jgi:hypothetical protein